MPVQVDLQVAGADEAWLKDAAVHTAQHGPHARHQLAKGEGFSDIIVGAQFQANETIRLLQASGEHNDRHVRLAPQRPANVQPIGARQIEIEDDQVRPFVTRHSQCRASIGSRDDSEAAMLQVITRQFDDFRLVIHYQDRLVQWREPPVA